MELYNKIKLVDEDGPVIKNLQYGLYSVASTAATYVPHCVNPWAKASVVDKVERAKEEVKEEMDKANTDGESAREDGESDRGGGQNGRKCGGSVGER